MLIMGRLSEYFRVCFGTFFGEGLLDRFGLLFGSMFQVCWFDFGSIVGVILEEFFYEKRGFTCMGAHFQTFLCFS